MEHSKAINKVGLLLKTSFNYLKMQPLTDATMTRTNPRGMARTRTRARVAASQVRIRARVVASQVKTRARAAASQVKTRVRAR